MAEIILHHYPSSPFAEKVRAILGAKQLTWKSVHIPTIMPKPDLIALTGGYRKTPVLQIGADIYCDTALIARKLDQLVPEPQLYPAHSAMSAESIASWADSVLFNAAVPLVFQPEVVADLFAGREQELQAFASDRAAMRKGATTPRLSLSNANIIVNRFLTNLDRQLREGRAFVLGEYPCIADFSIYHPLWFLWTKPKISELFSAFPAVVAWMQSMKEFGRATGLKMSSAEAISQAKEAQTIVTSGSSNELDFSIGDEVSVAPTDYGIDPVRGRLLHCDDRETVVERSDERAGMVAVHFPRLEYALKKIE